ncbi:sensor histidine kinase [Kribbella sp. CA-294648]|uniref:sensor histidine kinase n=1 Tax=Kribbella sp. CA-294648 TaxID=3239948 RepID=UPI003D8A7F20
MSALLRKLLASRTTDVVLAVIGLVVTQVWIYFQPAAWPNAPVVMVAAVALAPALIAFRRVTPVLAALGLVAGAYLSLLLGPTNWVLLAGAALAVWALPRRCHPVTVLATLAAVAGLPLLTNTAWAAFLQQLYVDQDIRRDIFDVVLRGITANRFERLLLGGWPWWQSLALLLVGLVAIAVSLQHRRPRARRDRWWRLDELPRFLVASEHSRALNVLLAFTATQAIFLELWRDRYWGNWWSAPDWMPYAIACTGFVLVLRRRLPSLVVGVLALTSLVTYWQTSTSWSVLAAFSIALYSLAVHRPLKISLPVASIPLVVLPVLAELARYQQMIWLFPELARQPVTDGFHNVAYEHVVDRQWPATLSLILALPVCVGVLVRVYSRYRKAAAREAALEQLAAEQDAAKAVLTERSHVARDLHDIVAHAVNLMVIQAETGPDLLLRDDREVLDGFQRIGDAGRRALGELDRLLSALRDADGVPDPQLTPQPGLAELRQLVEVVSHDRLTVELELLGDPDRPPAGHQLTAYRVVQEALTNVARHAKATRVTVLVKVDGAGIVVRVTDDGEGFDLDAAGSAGRHGLAGMRERVRIHSGEFEIRTAPGEGTTVAARIPVGTPAGVTGKGVQ